MKPPFYIQMGPTEIRDGELYVSITIPKWGIPFLIIHWLRDCLYQRLRKLVR